MPKLKTVEQFIIDARKKHGDKYDYSLVEYKNTHKKVKIICPVHTIFEQTPNCHLRHLGCPKCTYERDREQKMFIDKNTSYMIGLLQTDGSMSEQVRNRGRFQLGLSSKDEDVIYKLEKIIPYNSTIKKKRRKSHINGYHYNNEFTNISVYALGFRKTLVEWGIPYGKKSKTIKPPLHLDDLSIKDYVRGLYDGDGSLGMTAKNFPFISFTTDSEDIKEFLCEYISKVTGKPLKDPKRNNRDDIYNILVFKEDAVKMCEEVYYDGCLSLNRKFELAKIIKCWVRPDDMIVSPKKSWTPADDNFILTHEIDESMEHLGRTENSIKTRIWRLKK